MTHEELALRVRKLSQQCSYVSLQLHESIGKKAGLSGTDHKYLGFFIQKGQMTAGELAKLTGLTTGAVTGLIDRFEKKKLVKRRPDKIDRRKILIVPDTEKILALLKPFYENFQNNTDQLMRSFSSEELIILEQYFDQYISLMNQTMHPSQKIDKSNMSNNSETLDKGPFYHGTKADLQVGDLLTSGYPSNFNPNIIMNHIYFTALIKGAGLAAELAPGDGEPRVYLVEPTGGFENDPNVTHKKFPGNPTRSYRSKSPLKVIGEVTDWIRLSSEEKQQWKENMARLLADPNTEILN